MTAVATRRRGLVLPWAGFAIATLLVGHQLLLTVLHYFIGPALGLDPMSAGLTAATIVGAAAIIAPLLWLDLRRERRREAVGLTWPSLDQRTWRVLAIGLAISQLPLLILALQGATVWQSGGQAQLGVGRALLGASGSAAAVGLAIAVVVIAPVVEELLYRGYLLGALARRLPAVVAVLLAAFAFMLLHAEVSNWVASICLGVATGYCRVAARSIWPGLAVHVVSNAFGLWYMTLL